MNDIKPLVSIIVPVYNAGNYIEKCINSIVNQTLENIEIVIVNDGSTDDSLDAISKFANMDNRIKIVNQRNSGVSASRNKGIEKSTGEYIGFVDSDDYIELDMYEKMIYMAKKFNSDIVICNVKDIFETNKKISLEIKEGLISLEDITPKEFLKEQYFNLGTAVWHKIFKRSLILENNIKFINYDEVSSEDTIFNLQCMLKSKTIYCIDEPLYNYIIRENSLTKSKAAKENMIFRCGNTVEIIHNYCKSNSIEIDDYLEYVNYWEFINSLSYVYPKTLNNLSSAIKKYSKNKFYRDSLRKLIFSSKLDIYFINHKKSYNKVYKLFDRMFALLCYNNLNMLAAMVHLIRLKRTESIQSKLAQG